MTVIISDYAILTGQPPFQPAETNLKKDVAIWVQIMEEQSPRILVEGLKPAGQKEANINLSSISGQVVKSIAFGVLGSNELHYAENITIDPKNTLQFTQAVGTPPEYTVARISGKVQVDGAPIADRKVRAFSYYDAQHSIDTETLEQSKSLGHAVTDENGDYAIELFRGYSDPVFVVAFDDYGVAFEPSMIVQVGDRVHPTTPDGYVYECDSGGTLPEEEPAWVQDTEVSQTYGTATIIARPLYRPMVHGPVTPEVVDDGTSASG